MTRKLPESEVQYMRDLIDVAEIAVNKALEEAGLKRSRMSLRAAGKRYGAPVVKAWHEEGLVDYHKGSSLNSTIWIDSLQIEAVAKASNRAIFRTKNK